jgi:hypothetical protein
MPPTAVTLPTYVLSSLSTSHSPHLTPYISPHTNSSKSNTTGHADRNPDGTFTKGSELAKELGTQGGHAAHHESGAEDGGVSSIALARRFEMEGLTWEQRNADGTFKAGSKLAHDLGVQGGHASHGGGGAHESEESGVSGI